jgi:hypothetical protein
VRQGSRRRRSGRGRRVSRRTRLLLVFALLFAGPPARPARAACVEFASPPAISEVADGVRAVFAADIEGDGDLDAPSASFYDDEIA